MAGHPAKGAIWLKVNGVVNMSGTPAGVGPVKAGDTLEGHVDGLSDLTVTYAR